MNIAARVLILLLIVFMIMSPVVYLLKLSNEPNKNYTYSVLNNNVLIICKKKSGNNLTDCTASFFNESVRIEGLYNAQNIIVEEVK